VLLEELGAQADEQRWALSRAWAIARPTAGRLELLVDKVAHQAANSLWVGEDFRQALLDEAAAASIDPATLLDAVADRRSREKWSAVFDYRWHLPSRGPAPWWQRAVGNGWRWAATALGTAPLAQQLRPVAPSGLRVGPPLALMLAVLSAGRPAAAPSAASLTLAAPAATVVAVPTAAPPVAVVPTPAPVPAHVLVVAHTDGVGARLRTAPATGPVARLLLEGTAVLATGSETVVGGTDWREVRAPDGTPGWISSDLLQPADGPPGTTG
jgi:hypothetical protein